MGNVAYYRVSTKKQGESGLGLESQKAIVCHYINCDELVAEFVEVASGGNITDRPKLQKAVDLCISGGHTLVVANVDRLSRWTEDALDIYARLEKRLIACNIPEQPITKFTLTLVMAMADRERELISIRTKAALKAAKARGVVLGNPENLPTDAGKRGAESKIKTAQDAYRPLYNYIRMQREDGDSFDHIAKQLNDDGHRTRQGKPFQAMTVYRIMQRNGGE